MAVIPRQKLPQVKSRPVAGVKEDFPIPSGAFGADIRPLGAAITELTNVASKIALSNAIEDSDRRAKEGFAGFVREANDLLYGDGKYYSLEGAAAVDAFPGVRQSIQDLRQQYSDRTQSRGEKRIFDAASRARTNLEDGNLNKHAQTQRGVAADRATAAVVENAIDSATKSDGDPTIMGGSLTTVMHQVIEQGKRKGWESAQIQEAVETQQTALIARVVRAVKDNGQQGSALRAEEILNRYQTGMDKSVVSELRSELKNPKINDEAYAAFDGIVKDPRLTTAQDRRDAASKFTGDVRDKLRILLNNHEAAIARELAAEQKKLREDAINLANDGVDPSAMSVKIQEALGRTVSMVRDLRARARQVNSGQPLTMSKEGWTAFNFLSDMSLNDKDAFLKVDLSTDGKYYLLLTGPNWKHFHNLQRIITDKEAATQKSFNDEERKTQGINRAMSAAAPVVNSFGLNTQQKGEFGIRLLDAVRDEVERIGATGTAHPDEFYAELARALFLMTETDTPLWGAKGTMGDPNLPVYLTERQLRQSIVNFKEGEEVVDAEGNITIVGPFFDDIFDERAKDFVRDLQRRINKGKGADGFTLDDLTQVIESLVHDDITVTQHNVTKRAGEWLRDYGDQEPTAQPDALAPAIQSTNKPPARSTAPVSEEPPYAGPKASITLSRTRPLPGETVITYANGDEYVGKTKDGERNGKGTLTFADGRTYAGEWKDGNQNGQGTFTWPNGDKYVGEWKDGLQHGQGTSTLPDGAKYVGGYKDGNRHGQGTITSADGTSNWRGEWKDGEIMRDSIQRDPEGTSELAVNQDVESAEDPTLQSVPPGEAEPGTATEGAGPAVTQPSEIVEGTSPTQPAPARPQARRASSFTNYEKRRKRRTAVTNVMKTLQRNEGGPIEDFDGRMLLKLGLPKAKFEHIKSILGSDTTLEEAAAYIMGEHWDTFARSSMMGFIALPPAAQSALLDLSYAMGTTKVLNFPELTTMVARGDVDLAMRATLDTANITTTTNGVTLVQSIKGIAKRRARMYNLAVSKKNRIAEVEQTDNGRIWYRRANGSPILHYKPEGGRHPDSRAGKVRL